MAVGTAKSMILRDALLVTPRGDLPIGALDVRLASLAIEKGILRAIGPYSLVKQQVAKSAETIVCREGDHCRYLAMPGFIDGHNHSRQTALRAHWTSAWGLDESRPQTRTEMVGLFQWFLLDALKAGVTFVCDWPEHPGFWDPKPMDQIVSKMGLRGCLRVALPHDRGLPLPDPREAADYLQQATRRLGGKVQLGVWIPEEDKPLFNHRLLKSLGKLQRRLGDAPVLFQMHLAESKKRRDACKNALARLRSEGFLRDSNAARTVFIHAIWLGARGIKSLASRRDRVGVISCPKFSDGRLAPLKELLRKGVPIGLGSDVAVPDPFTLVRNVVAMHAKRSERKQISFAEAFHMATLGGATVFDMADTIGSLEPGKQADIVLVKNPAAIDLALFREDQEPSETLRCERIETIGRLFARNVLGKDHVDTVLVGGKVVLRNGELPAPESEDAILRAGTRAALSILKRISANPQDA